MRKLIPFFVIAILYSSCVSVEQYNNQIAKKHSPSELRADVDYAYKKLQKLHPDLYLYISKDSLDSQFNSLKNQLKQPMSSNDFYKIFAPVIAAIGQGHTSISPPSKKQTKEEKALHGKRKYLFRSIDLQKVKDKTILIKNYGKDSTFLIGSELLQIDGENVSDLLTSFEHLRTGDGYNTSFMPEFTRKYIGSFYLKTHPRKDSVRLTFNYKDSTYSKYLYAYGKKPVQKQKKEKKKKKTEVKKQVISKAKRKERRKWAYKYGYSKFTKEKTRSLKFMHSGADSTIAYMKIRLFENGGFKEFYKESFAKIDSAKSNYLIIDLRDNRGGRAAEIAFLYKYLTDKEHVFIKDRRMTKASNWMYTMLHSKSILNKSVAVLTYPLSKIAQIFVVKHVDGKPYLKSGGKKSRKPILEHNYKGKIFVLINGISFSSSSVLSANLKGSKRAFFVGDETGGAFNSTVAGSFVGLELPNSKAYLSFGLMVFETPFKDTPDGYGIKPDKYIETTTIEKDEQLEWVLNTIKSGKSN